MFQTWRRGPSVASANARARVALTPKTIAKSLAVGYVSVRLTIIRSFGASAIGGNDRPAAAKLHPETVFEDRSLAFEDGIGGIMCEMRSPHSVSPAR